VAPPGQDMFKMFNAEVENLALAEGMYKWAGEGVEERVLRLWGKQQSVPPTSSIHSAGSRIKTR
jgi:hypothetical protein